MNRVLKKFSYQVTSVLSFFVILSAPVLAEVDQRQVWDQVGDSPMQSTEVENTNAADTKAQQPQRLEDIDVQQKDILDGVVVQPKARSEAQRRNQGVELDQEDDPERQMQRQDKAKAGNSGNTVEEPLEKYLEPTNPPAKVSKIVDIYLENKSAKQGFLTGYTTKRADIDLKLTQHQPSNIPVDSRFQIANFGNYIRLGHEATGHLIGYSTNYFGYTKVYLEKDYYDADDFWSRFKIAPSGEEDWYLIRSYNEPKKCLAIGWSDNLRLKRCNTKDKWQKWRFLREKADAYWVPDADFIDLEIL